MTRREELIAMRGRDLIELANKLGVKVNASKTSLKESKAGVVDRIMKAEGAEVEDSNDNANPVDMSKKTELIDALVSISEIYPDIEVKKFDSLGAYDLFRNGQFIASVAPWDEGVGVATINTDLIDYDNIANELDLILAE